MKTLLFYICHTVIFASLLLQTLLNTLHNHIPYPHTHTRACTHWKYQVHNTTFLFHLPVSCCFVWLFIVFYVECYFLLVKYPFSPHFLYLLLLCMYNFSPPFMSVVSSYHFTHYLKYASQIYITHLLQICDMLDFPSIINIRIIGSNVY